MSEHAPLSSSNYPVEKVEDSMFQHAVSQDLTLSKFKAFKWNKLVLLKIWST